MQLCLKTLSFAIAMCDLLIFSTSFAGVRGEAMTYDSGLLLDYPNLDIDYRDV